MVKHCDGVTRVAASRHQGATKLLGPDDLGAPVAKTKSRAE
jgi:hypothetical protein